MAWFKTAAFRVTTRPPYKGRNHASLGSYLSTWRKWRIPIYPRFAFRSAMCRPKVLPWFEPGRRNFFVIGISTYITRVWKNRKNSTTNIAIWKSSVRLEESKSVQMSCGGSRGGSRRLGCARRAWDVGESKQNARTWATTGNVAFIKSWFGWG